MSLRDLQGKARMWYIGAQACFESALDVVNYNNKLLRSYGLGGPVIASSS